MKRKQKDELTVEVHRLGHGQNKRNWVSPKISWCSPTAVQHCLCAETLILGNLNCRQLLFFFFFFILWFKISQISICPNRNIIIFHWAETKLSKGFTWKKWKTSWYGTHGEGYTTHHKGWVNSPHRWAREIFQGHLSKNRKKVLCRTNRSCNDSTYESGNYYHCSEHVYYSCSKSWNSENKTSFQRKKH